MKGSNFKLGIVITAFRLLKGKYLVNLICMLLLASIPLSAQEAKLIQVKIFNEALEPHGGTKISMNGRAYIDVNDKGIAFIDIRNYDLPIKSIEISDQKLEAAFWNMSKGFLEIIVRNKSYVKVTVSVRGPQNIPISSLPITFKGSKILHTETNSKGEIELPLLLDERLSDIHQFEIDGYSPKSISKNNEQYVLLVDKIQAAPVLKESSKPIQDVKTNDYLIDFDLSKLDSIQSLTVFYAIIKKFDIDKLSPFVKQRIDDKFGQLVGSLQDSLKRNVVTILSNISDSTYVQDDIRQLKEQAKMENSILYQQREEFADKIKLVNDKLAMGLKQMDIRQRAALINDINELEQLLNNNEDLFYKNQNSYHQIIKSLKDRFFDIEQLEGELSGSEAERLKDKQLFKERILAVTSVVFIFALLIVVLIYFGIRLKRQKVDLAKKNLEVQHMNENLEEIVTNRTKQLEETFRELDTVLYRASHDLRAPVRSIEGLCFLAKSLSVAPNEVIERMLVANSSMEKLLKKLSIISEIHQPGNFASVYGLDIIKYTQRHFNSEMIEKNINFTLKCDDELPIRTIPNLLEIILTNLIENAIYYCALKDSNDSQITLEAFNSNGYLHIIITDNGVGIEKDIQNRLFEMFFKGNEFSQGNGLGLYIVKKSIQVLNGTIRVQSELGKFTKFEIKLPLAGGEDNKMGFLQSSERFRIIHESSLHE